MLLIVFSVAIVGAGVTAAGFAGAFAGLTFLLPLLLLLLLIGNVCVAVSAFVVQNKTNKIVIEVTA